MCEMENPKTQESVATEAVAEQKPVGKFNKFFGIAEKGSTIRTEIIAGIVTFLAMAYILTLNPSLITGDFSRTSPLWASVFIATALGAIVGTLLMAFVAKMPLAQAPGLGLNSMVGTMIGGASGAVYGMTFSFGNAMLIILISGILFLLLSLIKIAGVSIREKIFDGIPESIRGAISIGIGLFIAFIGLANAGVVVAGQGTLITMVTLSTWDMSLMGGALVCIFGLLVIAVLAHFNVKGAVIIGILAATLLGIPLGVTEWSGYTWKFWEYFENFFSMDPGNGGTFAAAFTEGFSFAKGSSIMTCIMLVITFCMIDMFDTMGTVVGCCTPVGLIDETGKPLHYDGIMMSDSIATCAGAIFGTSTVTTFVESGSGVAAGGRTGLTALSTAVMFFLSIFLLPVFASIPTQAAASALLYVGCLMLKGVKNLKLDSIKDAVPAFLTIAMMPLGYSITTGIGMGMLSYVLIDVFSYLASLIVYACNKEKREKPVWDLHVVTIIIAVLFIIYFFVPTKI